MCFEPQKRIDSVDECLIEQFHLFISDVGVLLITRAWWAVDAGMDVFDWAVAVGVDDDALGFLC